MKKILAEISPGELLDKISILEIKMKNISNPSLKKEIKKEYQILKKKRIQAITITRDINSFYKNLRSINLILWKLEDKIRALEKKASFKAEFIKVARSIYFSNDIRAKIKRDINGKLKSNITEIKSYKGKN
jgi:hypothetical protein